MGGVSSVLKTERYNICVANVSDQSERKYTEKFSTDMKIKAVCIRFSIVVILNIVCSQVRIAVCKYLFRNQSAVIFLNLLGLHI